LLIMIPVSLPTNAVTGSRREAHSAQASNFMPGLYRCRAVCQGCRDLVADL
jgi:hypothetical protein